MTRGTYLFKRDGVYYARIDVPTDLVAALGKETLKRSLKTKDTREAKSKLPSIIAEWQDLFIATRSKLAVSPSDREHAVWDHYTSELRADESERVNRPSETEIKAAIDRIQARVEKGEITSTDPLTLLEATLDVQVMKNAKTFSETVRRAKLSELKRHLASNITVLVADAVDDYLTKNKFKIARSTPEWVSLARLFMRAEIDALERTMERDVGNYEGVPKDPLIKQPSQERGSPHGSAAPGETIAEALEAFRKENPRNVSKSRIDEACRDIGIFIQTVGLRFPIANVTKKHVRDWKALLMKYPVRATEVVDLRGLTIAEAVAANEKLKRPVLSDRTVNRYLSSLSAFCSWAAVNGYITTNPCQGMALPKERRSKTLPFTSDQMNILFRSPLFTGAQSGDKWSLIARPGNVMIRDHRFWVPLIMLFTGARPGEIGQLALSDVREEHGHWIMHITTEGDDHEQGKTVKTEGSMRVVPLHPELIKLGLLTYHKERKAAGDRQLFPGATRNERGQMMSDLSREFGKYLKRIGLKDGRGLSLYSFRHGAADALRRAGHLDEQFGFLLGHTKASMTQRYGLLPQGMLDQRVELIRSIAYPGLQLGHLYLPTQP
ncbi:site-specific integrase [Paragemmobacter straminiformis]|uniref:Site-specific integrase n=1 Tax=Paragemmobacter straminiformis TaxID=2045119 RepID=A0A842I6B7_9RHOB|nr:site-specific integrase [Gemmobacter straminiformis]MBC2834488.1 site-specific integrase [Gemmobacter straminiformis]